MDHDQEHKSAEHTEASVAGDGTKAAAVAASSGLSDADRRAHLQRKYPTAATQRERYKAVAEEINKVRNKSRTGKIATRSKQHSQTARSLPHSCRCPCVCACDSFANGNQRSQAKR